MTVIGKIIPEVYQGGLGKQPCKPF